MITRLVILRSGAALVRLTFFEPKGILLSQKLQSKSGQLGSLEQKLIIEAFLLRNSDADESQNSGTHWNPPGSEAQSVDLQLSLSAGHCFVFLHAPELTPNCWLDEIEK